MQHEHCLETQFFLFTFANSVAFLSNCILVKPCPDWSGPGQNLWHKYWHGSMPISTSTITSLPTPPPIDPNMQNPWQQRVLAPWQINNTPIHYHNSKTSAQRKISTKFWQCMLKIVHLCSAAFRISISIFNPFQFLMLIGKLPIHQRSIIQKSTTGRKRMQDSFAGSD